MATKLGKKYVKIDFTTKPIFAEVVSICFGCGALIKL